MKPRMPSVHTLLEVEMRSFLAENPCLSDSELKRKVLELRNLPIDPKDPYWKEINRRQSYRGKYRPHGEHFKELFREAIKDIREEKRCQPL